MSIKQQTKRYGLFLLLPTLLLAQTGTGLKGDYFTNTALSGVVALSRVDPTINFEWGQNSPGTGIGTDKFSVRWTGQVEAPVTGAYTFATVSDDGVRLWVDGKLVASRWNDHGPSRDQSPPVTLTAGRKYDIQMEYYENTGGSTIRLRWAYPGQVEQVIPQGRLYPTAITLQPAPPVVSQRWLSDLPFLSATNGWGPVQRDRSNGETGANDGKTLRIDGNAYGRGLGVHARSEIRFALDDRFDMFKTVVGVDDEVGNNGSVVFEIYLDGVRKFQSPTMRGNMPGLAVAISTEDAKEMRLVVTDAGDGIGFDHADWADARFEGVERTTYLSDLRWVSAVNGRGEVERDNPVAATAGGKAPERLMLRGQSYRKGLGMFPVAEVKYNLDKKYERFSAVLGIDDTAAGRGSAIFEVWSGTTMLFKSDKLTGTSAPQHVSLMVQDKTDLILKVTDAGDGNAFDVADWADARLLPINSDAPPTAPPTTAPATPADLTATPGNALVNLSWKAATGATSYSIFRGTATNAQAATAIATNITGLTFQNTGLTNGTAYFYKVRAVNPIGSSNPSNEATATPTVVIVPAPPGAPTNLTATPGNARVSLAWQAVTGATSYNVYRSTTTNGQSNTPIASNVAGTTFNDVELVNGTLYFYKVRAVNGAGAGQPSNEASARPVAPPPPPPTAPTVPPTNLTATAGAGQISLSWAAATGATSYSIFRGTATNAQATTPIATNITVLTFNNTGLTNGTAYFYKVVGVNAGGSGPASAEVSATPLGAPAAPVLVSAVGADASVTLTWSAAPTAATYRVYRGTAAGQQAAVAVGTNLTTLTFQNTGLTNGTPYFFRVTAVNAGGESPRSNELSATPNSNAPTPDPATLSAFRLLRQASWGPKPGDIDRVKTMGRDAYLAEQFAMAPSAYPDTLYAMSVEDVQEHFMRLSLTGNDQLRQRVAFALSKIWAVNADDVNRADATVNYYRIFMNDAFGNYRKLMTDVTLNPAMGRFLNNLNSRSQAVTNAPAVENFARETLQLFTLGTVVMDNNGNPQPGSPYTIDDIRALARLFTGWTSGDGNPTNPDPTNRVNDNFRFPMEPVERFHDITAKTFLGQSFAPNRAARVDLDAALDVIFNHPNLPPYVAKSLIQQLVTSNPSPAYIGAVSAAFINNGSGVRGDLQAVVRAILTHPEANLGTNTAGKLMEPVLLVISPLRTLNATVSDFPFMSDLSEQMGQKVLYPPTVFSYFSPFYQIMGTNLLAPEFEILTSVTTLSRTNYMGRVLNADLNGSTTIDYAAYTSKAANAAELVDFVALQFMGGNISTEHRNAIISAVNVSPAADVTERVRTALYLVLTSAQYQVDR
ncbi:MAG: DUF1800 family protein [Bryobacteraceae bacterium]|nr:DUF1800 family protein [Bryobacteraceae bacterium]